MPSEQAPLTDVTVRPAAVGDAVALADLYLRSREAAYPAMPAGVHPPDDTRRWLRERVEADEVWLAEAEGAPVGLLLLQGSWVHSLYVAPDCAGQGVGALLLDLAKSLRPRGLGLWVFVSNEPARRFYERHGFVEVRRTDGTGPDGNEEQQPDIEMAWPDPDSLEGLRARIDDLDDQLARLLVQRAATTARIQQVKPVAGHAGRDHAREQQIAERMAQLAPGLGVDRLRRIMDAVITESLDAAAEERPGSRPHDPPARPSSWRTAMTPTTPTNPPTPLPEDVRELLRKPNPAVICSVRPDGQPVSVATWYLLDGDRILVNMDEGRKRLDYLRADPRVSVTVLDEASWYTHVSVRGRVVEWSDDVDLSDIDRLSRHYTDQAYPTRDRRRVSAWIEVESWHGWGGAARS